MKRCAVAILVFGVGIFLAHSCVAQEPKLLTTLEGHTSGAYGGVWSVAFSPDGALLASGGTMVVKLWNLKSRKEKDTLTLTEGGVLSNPWHSAPTARCWHQ